MFLKNPTPKGHFDQTKLQLCTYRLIIGKIKNQKYKTTDASELDVPSPKDLALFLRIHPQQKRTFHYIKRLNLADSKNHNAQGELYNFHYKRTQHVTQSSQANIGTSLGDNSTHQVKIRNASLLPHKSSP